MQADLRYILSSLTQRVQALETLRQAKHGPGRSLIYLSARLDPIRIGKNAVLLSEGDDGFIVWEKDQDGNFAGYIIKAFKSRPGKSKEELELYKQTTRDQATRELKAMRLLAGHPNIMTLTSTELDECQVTDRRGFIHPEGYALRIGYVPNLKDMTSDGVLNRIELILQAESPEADSQQLFCHVDYNHRQRLEDYLWGQGADIANALKSKGIYHRDLDNCNIRIQMPTLRIYLMDFARADVPSVEGLDESPDPEELYKESETIDRDQEVAEKLPVYVVMYHRARMERYKNLNYDVNGVCSDGVMLYTWINEALEELDDSMKSRMYHGRDTEIMIAKKKRNANKVLFKEDKYESLLGLAAPPEEDLEQFRRVYELYNSRTSAPTFFLPVPMEHTVHTQEYLSQTASQAPKFVP